MARSKRELGKLGEKIAYKFLAKKGYKILINNYQKLFGEIDIIAKDSDNTLVFVEVKARTSSKFGSGAESVTKRKQERLIKTAYSYLNENKIKDDNFRIDVLSIDLDFKGKKGMVTHFKNAVEENL